MTNLINLLVVLTKEASIVKAGGHQAPGQNADRFFAPLRMTNLINLLVVLTKEASIVKAGGRFLPG